VKPTRRLLTIGLCLAVAVCLTSSRAPELGQEGTVIAILDMDRILRDSKAAATLRAEIDKQREAHQTTLRDQENALRTADQELARQRAVLSAEAFTAKRRELQDQANKLQQEFVSRQREMEQLFGQGIGQVRKALAEVAKEIADERGISLILLKQTIVLASRELDITDEALRRLDERLPSVDFIASGN
jgi:Skp family chaperone for outer membrane proteins